MPSKMKEVNINKIIRKMVLESFMKQEFVIVNTAPELSAKQLPMIFYNAVNNTFVSDLETASKYDNEISVNLDADKAEGLYPRARVGIYTTEVAAQYLSLIQHMYSISKR